MPAMLLAFGEDDGGGGFVGFHGLPEKIADDSEQIFASAQKQSGKCIAMMLNIVFELELLN